MTSQEPSNPVVHRLVAAVNDGDRDAFLATLTDDGNPRSLRSWIDREIFAAHGRMNVEHVSTPDWDVLCPGAFSQIHDQPNTDSALGSSALWNGSRAP